MGEMSKTNLLIDSLSEDSDDVPDLQLIPPVKAKKKKLRKVTVPKWPSRSKLEEERSDSSGGVSHEFRRPGSRCWICSLSLVLVALLTGLILCSLFCLRLYKEVEVLKNNFKVSSTEFREKINKLDDRVLFVQEKQSSADEVNVSSASGATTMLPVVHMNLTMQDVASLLEFRRNFTSLQNELNDLKAVLQNITRIEATTTTTTSKVDALAQKLLENPNLEELQKNFTLSFESCTKLCSTVPATTIGPNAQPTANLNNSTKNQSGGRP